MKNIPKTATIALASLAVSLAACTPVSKPSPSAPTLTWRVRNQATNQVQNANQNGTVHLGSGKYSLSFFADASGGLRSMALTGQGSVEGTADNGFGGTFTNGFHQVSLPPQNRTFGAPSASSALVIQDFDYFSLDLHSTVRTDRGSKKAVPGKGTITLRGQATDTSGRTSNGTLQMVVP